MNSWTIKNWTLWESGKNKPRDWKGIEMVLIACIDDKNGMMFHNRRQSQDRVLREHILREPEDKTLWMSPYSYRQFSAAGGAGIQVDENFLERAKPGDWCFIEAAGAATYEAQFEKIVLFKWNRTYPADVRFDIPLAEHGWKLVDTETFRGSSHEKITKEVYIK